MVQARIKKDKSIKHNGKWYKADMKLDLSQNDFQNLLLTGIVEPVKEPPKVEISEPKVLAEPEPETMTEPEPEKEEVEVEVEKPKKTSKKSKSKKK